MLINSFFFFELEAKGVILNTRKQSLCQCSVMFNISFYMKLWYSFRLHLSVNNTRFQK